MTWYQAALTASPTNRQVFMDTTLHNALLAEGWVHVKDWTSPGTGISRTYRNPLANNGLAEFYITVTRTNATTDRIWIMPHGKFDASTNVMDVITLMSGSAFSNLSVRADGTWNQTFTTSPHGSTNQARPVYISDSAYSYFMRVRPDGLVLGTGGTFGTVYFGVYEPWHTPVSVQGPVFGGDLTQWTGSAIAGVLALPNATVATTANSVFQITPVTHTDQQHHPSVDPVANRLYIVDVLLRSYGSSPFQGIYGRLPDIGHAQTTGMTAGDVLTVGADEWALMYNGVSWVVKK